MVILLTCDPRGTSKAVLVGLNAGARLKLGAGAGAGDWHPGAGCGHTVSHDPLFTISKMLFCTMYPPIVHETCDHSSMLLALGQLKCKTKQTGRIR